MSIRGRADMHLHSNASDGYLSPSELVEEAYACGLECIALCDHDTIAGVSHALHRGRDLGIDVIPGIELGVCHADAGDVSMDDGGRLDAGELHMLGYGIESRGHLDVLLRGLQESRRSRIDQILQRLEACGLFLSWEEVQVEAGSSESVGRPHVARALVNRGHCGGVREAFSEYLAPGRPGYVPRKRLTAGEGIEAILSAGGIPVVAHPGLGGRMMPGLPRLVEMGVMGIEVVHPDHSHAVMSELIRFARRHGLFVTGGSDYHGRAADPRLGEVTAPAAWARALTR